MLVQTVLDIGTCKSISSFWVESVYELPKAYGKDQG